ncbi:MAG: T9SS type A sorting domain-containing protein [Saprospiraceae bacterium]
MILRKIILALLVLGCIPSFAENYSVTIHGRLLDGKGNGIPDKIIKVYSPTAQKKFTVSFLDTTQIGGIYKAVFTIPDSVLNGVVLVSFQNCNGKEIVSEQRFSKEKPIIELNLLYCERAVLECKTSIVIKKVNDSLSYAIAIHSNPFPFKTKWSDGTVGDTLDFNPLRNVKFCAVTTDSLGCISEACYVNEKACGSVVLGRRLSDTSAIAYVVAKGTGPIKHTWSTGAVGDTIHFNPLNKIKICVRSVDSIGCVSEACLGLLIENCVAAIEREKNVLYAYLRNDLPKSYKWSNGSDRPFIEVSDTGTYCVKIISITGCESSACFHVKELVNTTCKAEIIVDTLGSDNQNVPPGYKLSIKADYNLKFIEWNTGEKTPQIVVRKSGEYCVTISDNIQCKDRLCKVIRVPEPKKCELSIFQERVPATSTSAAQKIKLTVKFSGTPTIMEWSTNEKTASIIVSKSGEYCVTVSDGIDCKKFECVKVVIVDTIPNPPITDCKASISVRPVSSKEVILTAKFNGRSPLNFKWSNGSLDNAINIKESGHYCVVLKDGSGCTAESCVDIEIDPNSPGLSSPTDKSEKSTAVINNKIELKIYPNPSEGNITYDYLTVKDGDANLTIINMYGKMVYQEKIKVIKGKSQGGLDASFLPPGIYQIVMDQQGTMVNNKLVISK